MNKILIVLALVGLSGCATTVDPYVDRASEEIAAYNNTKYAVSKAAACSSPLRLIMEEYAKDPSAAKGLMSWCGYRSLVEAYKKGSI